ncbi:hypothetical protein H9L39_00196 [Fusarium oxysporum f. sp. albedinis]|nr:hypothetical protein H9L39_00196 [Fusarium oxysporum f. sp. albedinis]
MSDTSPPERVTAIHRRTPSRHTRTFSLFHGAYHDDPCFGKGWQIDGLVDWAVDTREIIGKEGCGAQEPHS